MAPGNKIEMDKTTLKAGGPHDGSDGHGTTPALTILYHPSLERAGDRAILDDLAAGKPVLLSRSEPPFAPVGQGEAVPLGDDYLSRRPLRLAQAAHGGVILQIGDSGTTVVVNGRQVAMNIAFSAAQIARGIVLDLSQRVVLLLHAVTSLQGMLGAAEPPGQTSEITGASDALRRVLWEVHSVADLDLPVLLRGENGTGKELVAHAIRRQSSRRDKPFVAVNLAAVAPGLAYAELFGAEKGAFPTAVRRDGYFQQADGGTLFLDEIGEVPVEIQVALLRVLETGEIQPVGGKIRKVDVRVIAATDADLDGKVRRGTFRAALLNRLASYEIWIPPLRERRDDIGRLLVRFLREVLETTGESHRLDPPSAGKEPWLPSSLVAQLADHDWPGNVRQLKNVVQQLVIGNRGQNHVKVTPAVERLLAEHPPPESPPPGGVSPAKPAAVDEIHLVPAAAPQASDDPKRASPIPPERRTTPRKPAGVTEPELRDALRACRWELEATAQTLGTSRASIYNLCERYRVRTAGDLSNEEIIQCHRECNGNLTQMAERLEVSERALARRMRELGLV